MPMPMIPHTGRKKSPQIPAFFSGYFKWRPEADHLLIGFIAIGLYGIYSMAKENQFGLVIQEMKQNISDRKKSTGGSNGL